MRTSSEQGRRYPLWLILLEGGDRHPGADAQQLLYVLEDLKVLSTLSEKQTRINRSPSDTTFSRILQRLDFQPL